MKTKWNTPELLVDDHHGVFMMQMLVKENQKNNNDFFKQVKKSLSENTINSLLNGPDDEFHFDACDCITNMTFKTKTNQKYRIDYAEGGIWAIPFCFKGKKLNDFFGC